MSQHNNDKIRIQNRKLGDHERRSYVIRLCVAFLGIAVIFNCCDKLSDSHLKNTFSILKKTKNKPNFQFWPNQFYLAKQVLKDQIPEIWSR